MNTNQLNNKHWRFSCDEIPVFSTGEHMHAAYVIAMILKSINSLHPVNNTNDYSRTCVYLSHILLAYENGDCPAISVPQNGSVAQEAPNLLNQAKVCHFPPIKKLACGMSQ